MPKTYPIEYIIRAFGLSFDGFSASEISDALSKLVAEGEDYPKKATIEKWARDGEMIDGDISWYQIREIAENLRLSLNVREERRTVRKQAKPYIDFANDALSDLSAMQDAMQLFLSGGQMKFTVADYNRLVKTRHEVETALAKIELQENKQFEMIGKIFAATMSRVAASWGNEKVKGALREATDIFLEEVERFMAFGGDSGRYEITIEQAAPIRLIEDGDSGD